METNDELQRAVELAVLREQFKALNEHVTRLEGRMAGVDVKLDAVLATLTEARGGWKMLMGVGGAGALAGTFLWSFVEKWMSR